MKNLSSPWRICMLMLVAVALFPQLAVGQDKDKQAEAPKPNALVDAWRGAIPQAEQLTPAPDVSDASSVEAKYVDPAEVERRLLDLEYELAEAVKQRDEKNLARFLAPDFTFTNEQSAARSLDKAGYINSIVKATRAAAYKLNRTTVRLYGETAVVQTWFVPQGETGGAATGEKLWTTDVWVKQSNQWQVVARHASRKAFSAK